MKEESAHARSLLGAADARRRRSEPEDRLTEILREVLMSSPLLASWLVEKGLDLPPEEAKRLCQYDNYEVETQVQLPGGGRPDMAFRFKGESPPRGRLYCENKILAGWTSWQLQGYPGASRGDRFLVLSPDGRRPCDLPQFVPIRWTDIARQIYRKGQSWGGPDWLIDALEPRAPSEYRLLAELLWYLEREVNVSTPRPITEEDLSVLPDVNPAVTRWKRFRGLVLEQLLDRNILEEGVEKEWEKRWYPVARPATTKKEELACAKTLRYLPGWEGAGWPPLSRLAVPVPPKWSWRELILAPVAPWMDQDRPFVAVGVAFEGISDWSRDGGEWCRLLAACEEAGAWLGFTDREKIYRILIARPLAEMMPAEETLDAQAEATVDWAIHALEGLMSLEAAPE